MQVKKKIILSILLAIIAGLYSINYFRNVHTISTSGDIAFHFARVKGLSSIFSGPINFTTFNHYGSGVNYFYPYLTFFPAVIFYWISNNLIVSYILYVWLLNVCTIMLMFHYGLKFLKRIDAAFIFSCLYTFYGYRTIDIYHRSAIAEAIALTVIPIVMYYAYALIYEKKPCAIPLAVSMSLLIYTHVLSTFMSVIAVGLLVLGGFVVSETRKKESIRLIVELSKAVGMTILLTAYFWYPMFRQIMVQSINEPDKTTLQHQALNVSDSLIGAMNNDLTTFTVGIIGIISLICPFFFFKGFNRKEKVIYLSAVVSWLLSTKFFPWSLLQNTPIQMIQFPWRILGFQVLFGSLILSFVFMKSTSAKQRKVVNITTIVLLLLAVSAATKANYEHKVVTQRDHLVMNQENLIRYTTLLPGGLYDYAPTEALQYKEHLQNHEVRIGKEWHTMPYQVMDSKIVYTVHESKGQKITLPVFDYWGTVAKVNGQKREIDNSEGLVSIEGTQGETIIEVSSIYPPTMKLAFLISLCSYLFLLISFLIRKLQHIKIMI